ncbi:uncharacterized protein N7482_006592 [Penicillium canariense]|uniref:Uncharacterized protein n=1 Tax=Penicillium canariense TaxID=189055 RepID=A0A9W9LJI5_9EURO|nr:uncharacterized protein N7482_006592 [Penicillium canariense]KAJ5159588.1 hypothetical protein N7482_006592 [Penicillium canariense]
MPHTAISFSGPLTPAILSSHPVITWYAKYAAEFVVNKHTTAPTKYYAREAKLVNTDNSTIHGAREIWDYYIALYGQFERCSHEMVSVTLLTDEQTGKHTLHIECITSLHLKGSQEVVPLPQSFVYEISEAEAGYGCDGLQIWEIRCYYDRGLLQRAAERS